MMVSSNYHAERVGWVVLPMVVLSVVHFNHKLRGAESDLDQAFVAALAREHGLEFYCEAGDVGGHAAQAVGLGAITFLPWSLGLLIVAGGMLLGCLGGLIVARGVRSR